MFRNRNRVWRSFNSFESLLIIVSVIGSSKQKWKVIEYGGISKHTWEVSTEHKST